MSGIVLADALSSAVSEFDGVMKQKKEKDDRLTYALTRNEIQIAAIETEDEFAEDPDWATTDTRYTESFNKRREAIMAGATDKGMSPADTAILGAEGDLILARGRVSIGGSARKTEIGQGVARFKAGMEAARIALDTKTSGEARNGVILGQLDAIDAAEEKGYLLPEEAQAYREKMTQDFALGSLDAMGDPELIEKIEKALRGRKDFAPDLGEYESEIISASSAHGVPEELLFAQMNRESSGDPNAKSGARGDPTGLMQLGRDAASDMGVTDRTNPQQSINGGAKYDAAMLALFDGDKAKALAAYNMGPGALEKVIKKHGDDWIKNVPTETLKYMEALLPVWESAGEIKADGKHATGIGGLSAEDIRNGKGTGSVADFVHSDLLTKRYDAAKNRQKENRSREEAQAGLDIATELFPESHKKRMAWIKENLTGDAREYAETNAEQLNNSEIAIAARENAETMDQALKAIDAGTIDAPFNVGMIDTTAYSELDYGQQQLLDAAIKSKITGLTHADPGDTHISPRGDGLKSLQDWEDLPTYAIEGELGPLPDTETKETANLDSPEWALALDETAQVTLKGTQKIIVDGKHAQLDTKGKTQNQIVTNSLDALNYGGVTDAKKRAAIKGRLLIEFDRKIREKQASFTPQRTLTGNETMEIWNQMLVGDGEVDVFFGGSESVDYITMTPDQLEEAFEPLESAKTTPLPKKIDKELGGYGNTVYDYLEERQKELKAPFDEERMARAYFAFKNGMAPEEMDRRLEGK